MLFAEDIENNLLLAFPDEGIADAIDTAQRSILIGACVATVIVLGARWHAASRPRRRALLPTLAGSFVLLIYTALLINDLATGERSQTLLWIASCSLVTVPLAFLAGLLRSRLARAGLSDLFRDLRGVHGRGAAGDARAGARRSGPRRRLRRAARPPRRPLRRADRARRPAVRVARLRPVARRRPRAGRGGRRRGRDRARERRELHAESEARLAELQASRGRIVAAGDAERRRLERNLHDGAQQRLVALAMQLRMIQADIRRDPARRRGAASRSASGELAQSLAELRELARGIHPGGARLRPLARARVAGRPLAGPDRGRLRRARPPATAGRARRLLRGLRGAGQRRQVRRRDGRVGARSSRTDGGVAIEIADDGAGGALASAGSGLHGLQDRVEALGGHLLVTSPAGDGTVVTARAPLRLRRLTPGIRSGLRETGQSTRKEEVGCPSPPSSSDPCRAR